MKHRIKIRRRDGIRQRYWVGRKLRRNYGSKMIRDQIKIDIPTLSEEGFHSKKDFVETLPGSIEVVLPQKYRRKEVISVLEKNPELYKEFRKTKPTILFKQGGTMSKHYPSKNLIVISDDYTKGGFAYDKQEDVLKRQGLEQHLRHEIRHATGSQLVGRKKYEELPKSFTELSAESAELVSTRKRKVPQEIRDFTFRRVMENV